MNYCSSSFLALTTQFTLLMPVRILLQRSPLQAFASHLFSPSSLFSSLFIISGIRTLSSWGLLVVYPRSLISACYLLCYVWVSSDTNSHYNPDTFPVGHFCAYLIHQYLKNNFIIPAEKLPHFPSSLQILLKAISQLRL